MTSLTQQAVAFIQQVDYSAVVIFTAVGYDYILTFPDEVQYIWTKPWTRISTLFVLARYFALCCAVTINIVGTSFLPAITKVYVLLPCDGLIILYRWGFLVFISAAELVMILRVWALYRQSRAILAILLPFYTIEVVVSLIAAIVYTAQSNSGGEDFQVLNYSFCYPQTFSAIYPRIIDISQLTLGTLMCLFIGFRFIQEVYKTPQRIQLNHYAELFMGEGVLYYFSIVMLALIDLIALFGVSINLWVTVVQYVPAFTLVSRFILNLRTLYARNSQGRYGNDIDTAFGLASANCTEETTMVFAAGQNHGWERGDVMEMEDRMIYCAGSDHDGEDWP